MLDKVLLQQMIDEKYVSVQKHPTANIFIYNYTANVQYERKWNEITMLCRGLILDENMNIVERPFKKFFNKEEHTPEEIPDLPFDAFEKMDGSMGILYWIENKPFICTRGSFTSDQSIHATKILYDKYSHTFTKIKRSKTHLFEIIYPTNRIVVDYGDMDDLVFLTAIDKVTGEESVEDIGFPIVKKYDGINDIEQLKLLESNNKEGFVIRFSNGFRVKMKFEEYCRLHKIITNCSNIVIWEHLSQGKPLLELLEKVPDEFYDYVKHVQSDLIEKFNLILEENKCIFNSLNPNDTRKEKAMFIMKQKNPGILFCMLDNKKPDDYIWKMIRPKFSKPFSNYEE